MKGLILCSLLLLSTVAQASRYGIKPWIKNINGVVTFSADGTSSIDDGEVVAADLASASVTSAKISDSDGAPKIACGTVTAAQLVAAGTAVPVNFGPTFADDVVIMKVFYKVTTTFAGDGDDSSTLSIGLNTDVDLKAATAISAGGDIWDAGAYVEGIADNLDSPANWVQATAASRRLHVEWTAVATDTTLSAGSMYICALYFQGV